MDNIEGYLTAKEAAAKVGYSAANIRLLANKGKVKAVKRRSQWFFREEDLKVLFSSNSKKITKKLTTDDFDLDL